MTQPVLLPAPPPAPGGANLALGAAFQVVAASTGMPLEVWKTRQGAYPSESALQALRNVYRCNGGVVGFWGGSGAKMIESATKGGILVTTKESVIAALDATSVCARGTAANGAVGGFIGGLSQTVVMAPLTYVVTYKMRCPEARGRSTFAILRSSGLRQAYASTPALAMRQGSNWMLRQGMNDFFVERYRASVGGRKLSNWEKCLCGIAGGCAASINQPFEVLRIRLQADHSAGRRISTTQCARQLYLEAGLRGYFVGLLPRCLFTAYQTLFMVTFVGVAREQLEASWRTASYNHATTVTATIQPLASHDGEAAAAAGAVATPTPAHASPTPPRRPPSPAPAVV